MASSMPERVLGTDENLSTIWSGYVASLQWADNLDNACVTGHILCHFGHNFESSEMFLHYFRKGSQIIRSFINLEHGIRTFRTL